MLPALQRALRWTPTMKRFRAAMAKTDELMFTVIEERRAEAAAGDDVLAMLLSARHEDGSPMSRQELRDELMTALVAGHETTASQLAWALERLAREPGVVARLSAELDRGQSAYLDATVTEILRLRPVLPNAEPRLVKQPVTIGGVQYPPGIILLASAFLIQHDPAIYPEPYAFRPERFLETAPEQLHVDPLRRRSPSLPGRELRPAGDEDRPARGRAAVHVDQRRRAGDDAAPGDHLQPARGRRRRARRAGAGARAGRRAVVGAGLSLERVRDASRSGRRRPG